MEKVDKLIESLKDEVIFLRREIHMFPETAFEEYRTSDLVFGYLKNLALSSVRKVNKTGVVADLLVDNPKGTVLLRADMDALPIQEEVEAPYRSKIDGKMHACGHDAHTAMLLVAAKVLSEIKDELDYNVKFVFQPSEEHAPGGAIGMIEEGVLENPKVDFAFATHVDGFSKAGIISTKSGVMTAEADSFKITILGYGGHGAYPHKAVDPILIASHIVIALQSIVSREVDPLEPAVVSIGKITSGDVFNVIPERGELFGTVRTLKREVAEFISSRITDISMHIANSLRGKVVVDYNFGYLPLCNNELTTDYIKKIGELIVGKEHVQESPISMGGEDMSYFLQKVPGTFYWLGVLNKEKGIIHPNHSPKFDIDEDVLPIGVKMHVYTVLHLNRLSHS